MQWALLCIQWLTSWHVTSYHQIAQDNDKNVIIESHYVCYQVCSQPHGYAYSYIWICMCMDACIHLYLCIHMHVYNYVVLFVNYIPIGKQVFHSFMEIVSQLLCMIVMLGQLKIQMFVNTTIFHIKPSYTAMFDTIIQITSLIIFVISQLQRFTIKI